MAGASRAGEAAVMVWCLKAFQRQLAALMFCVTLVNAGLESAHCINIVFSSVSVMQILLNCNWGNRGGGQITSVQLQGQILAKITTVYPCKYSADACEDGTLPAASLSCWEWAESWHDWAIFVNFPYWGCGLLRLQVFLEGLAMMFLKVCNYAVVLSVIPWALP